MITFTSIMKAFLLPIVLIASLALLGCDDTSSSDPYSDYPQAQVSHSSGTQWSSTHGYLALPFNVGTMAKDEATCLILGNQLEKEEKVNVDIIGGIKVSQDSTEYMLVLAQPADVNLRTIKIKNLNHLATVHSAAKWQIEQFITHYQGMGSARVLGWEDEKYVKTQLGIQ